MLILQFGRLMHIGFEKVLLMQNDLNRSSSEIIQTYVYNISLGPLAVIPNYSYSTAIGLFNSVVGFILIIVVNQLAKRISNISLW